MLLRKADEPGARGSLPDLHPVVLPGSQRIEVTLLTDQDVMLTIDGQEGLALREHDRVEVWQAAPRARLVRFPQKHFFSVLRAKLKWGER